MNNMQPANPNEKICAFCRHWYDPTNSCIQPQSRIRWLFDKSAQRKCLKKNLPMQSWAGCKYHESKL